ncbi:MAG: BamA/TamA family outer membrane protein [Muribaculaceae bacterium]|nr:BamA/TamA family outer membrane protein [Muribaculaceae bacterium]
MKRFVAYLSLVLCGLLAAQAQTDTVAHRNLWQRMVGYLSLDKEDSVSAKPLRWVVLGGPHYSSEQKLGVALSGIASFRLSGCDSLMQPSSAMAFVDVSTAGFWSTGLSGDILFPRDARRVNVDVRFGYSPYDFWGMGYDMGRDNANKTRLHQRDVKLHADMIWRLVRNFYAGPSVEFNYSQSGDLDRPELLRGMRQTVRNYGAGFTLQYDSRDLINNATRGGYVYVNQLFRPKLMGNHYAFSTTDFKASLYRRAWQGAVIAAEARATLNFGHPSWAMMAQLGGSQAMRGYYKGRFRDKHAACAQVELRQHVWHRSGVVVWLGGGNVFHGWRSLTAHFLPNYGAGYRWEVRRGMNLRLDYGFGSHGCSGFTFSMYEAF